MAAGSSHRNLIHRDVKPANILAVVEEQRLLKVLLADFGEAKQLTRSMSRVSGAGTPVYMAPEMTEEDDAKGPKVDVFSAGVVAVELNTGQSPNPGPQHRKFTSNLPLLVIYGYILTDFL